MAEPPSIYFEKLAQRVHDATPSDLFLLEMRCGPGSSSFLMLLLRGWNELWGERRVLLRYVVLGAASVMSGVLSWEIGNFHHHSVRSFSGKPFRIFPAK